MADGKGEGTPAPSGDPVPEPTEPGTGLEQASVFSRRAFAVLVAALFAFGSCGVALGLYQLSRTDDGGSSPAPSPPIPAPSASSSPSPSESPSPTAEPAPDLVVTELTATGVTVTNVGDAPTGRFVVSVGGTAFTVEDGLEPGASESFEFKCRQGPFTAVADSTERVEESDETNNARTAGPFDCQSPSPSPSPSPSSSESPSPSPTVSPSPTQTTPPPALPDLVVRSVSSDRVTVANIGNGSAGGFVVDVGPAGTFSIGGLAAGRSATVSFPCTDGTLTATVDASGRVRESNERNNSRSGGPFQCLPDLIVSSLGLNSVTIANIGRGDAGPSIVTVGGQALSVPPLRAGEKVQLSYQCVGGDVTAFADAQQQVVESNEGNNKRSAAVGQCSVP